ncbi:MAG: hypothetical protein ACE5D6_09075, partial [Candidatus Zixiibacteriota bacterium]
MRNTLRFLIVFLLLFSLENAFPQQPELVVGDVDLPTLKWGEETANIELTNNSEYIKFIVVMAELNFSGSYLTPSRATRSHYFIEPYGKKEIHPKFNIPGNYGEAELKIVMYDIADTLDAIFPEQIFFEQKFNIRFNMTDDIIGYLQEKISLPPRV